MRSRDLKGRERFAAVRRQAFFSGSFFSGSGGMTVAHHGTTLTSARHPVA
jgi:hypothetical protein